MHRFKYVCSGTFDGSVLVFDVPKKGSNITLSHKITSELNCDVLLSLIWLDIGVRKTDMYCLRRQLDLEVLGRNGAALTLALAIVLPS